METLKVIKVLQMQQGTAERGQWKSQDIVVEAQQNVQYHLNILFELWISFKHLSIRY